MKVLLGNNFHPSFETISKYIELSGEKAYLYEWDHGNGTKEIYTKVEEYDWYNTLVLVKDFGETTFLSDRDWKYNINVSSHEYRTDPVLIQAFEESVDKGNLRIVEIPDDVDFYIHEWDNGAEVIYEKHRSWS